MEGNAADTGGAAADIYSYCIGEFDPETACTGKLAMEYLPGIKELGEVEVGVRKAKMLTFFHLSSDYSEHGNEVQDLSTQILNAILSDCERTVDAINLAVRPPPRATSAPIPRATSAPTMRVGLWTFRLTKPRATHALVGPSPLTMPRAFAFASWASSGALARSRHHQGPARRVSGG